MEQKFGVEQIVVHEDFDNTDGNFNNDVGKDVSDAPAGDVWRSFAASPLMVFSAAEAEI